ncbi:MAG: nucleoside triphosphate pyrophosphohydrolase [Prevotella sp.]|nr:nucleoside triphosphate pyrophosphohydrolase [Prevotella sp.]
MHTKEEKMKAFGRFLDVLDALRANCPWDKKQTNESLRPNTIEETYELCDALIKNDIHDICKELGDVLLHICFYAKIAEEQGQFDMADVCDVLTKKMITRHPHVYHPSQIDAEEPKTIFEEGGDFSRNEEGGMRNENTQETKMTTVSQVLQNWEQIKLKEKDGNERVLSGVPAALPSVIKAYRIQDKARNVGFDWEKREDVWLKVREELDELEAELNKDDKERSTEELGDFLFAVINAARLYKLNPDNALEMTNRKFIERFNYIEEHSIRVGKPLTEMTLEEMEKLWQEAKTK